VAEREHDQLPEKRRRRQRTGAEVTIQGNTVTGLGTIDFIAQNGIQISAGASATVIGNSVSNNFYTAKSYTATGCSALICRLHG
jgi:hypothetical protein